MPLIPTPSFGSVSKLIECCDISVTADHSRCVTYHSPPEIDYYVSKIRVDVNI